MDTAITMPEVMDKVRTAAQRSFGENPGDSMLRFATMSAETACDNYVEAAERVAKSITSLHFDHWDVDAMTAATVELRFWLTVVQDGSPDPENVTISLDGLAGAVKQTLRPLLRGWGGTSTSMSSNADDAAKQAFAARVLEYYGDLVGITIP